MTREGNRRRHDRASAMKGAGKVHKSVNPDRGIPRTEFTNSKNDDWQTYKELLLKTIYKALRTKGKSCLTAEEVPEPPAPSDVPYPSEEFTGAAEFEQEVQKMVRAKYLLRVEEKDDELKLAWMVLAIYARVSSGDQGRGGSIQNQLRYLVDLCVRRKVAVGFIAWDDKTGRSYDRPGFEALSKALAEGVVDGAVARYVDRFGRDFKGGIDRWFDSWESGRPWMFPEFEFGDSLLVAAMGVPAERERLLVMLNRAEAENEHRTKGVNKALQNAYREGHIPNGITWSSLFWGERNNGEKGKAHRRWPVLLDEAQRTLQGFETALKSNDMVASFGAECKKHALRPNKVIWQLRHEAIVGPWCDRDNRYFAADVDSSLVVIPSGQERRFWELQTLLDAYEDATARRTTSVEVHCEKYSTIEVYLATNGRVAPFCGQCSAKLDPKVAQSRGHAFADLWRCRDCERDFLFISKTQKKRLEQVAMKVEGHYQLLLEYIAADLRRYDLRGAVDSLTIAAKVADAIGVKPDRLEPSPGSKRQRYSKSRRPKVHPADQQLSTFW